MKSEKLKNYFGESVNRLIGESKTASHIHYFIICLLTLSGAYDAA